MKTKFGEALIYISLIVIMILLINLLMQCEAQESQIMKHEETTTNKLNRKKNEAKMNHGKETTLVKLDDDITAKVKKQGDFFALQLTRIDGAPLSDSEIQNIISVWPTRIEIVKNWSIAIVRFLDTNDARTDNEFPF